MSNHTERIGVNHCGMVAERNKWMFREQPIDDVGIDAHMEITEPTGKPKQLRGFRTFEGYKCMIYLVVGKLKLSCPPVFA